MNTGNNIVTHTPAPWIVRINKNEIQIWENRMVQKVLHSSCIAVINGDAGRDEQYEADANLIAASPVLFKALKNLVKQIREIDPDTLGENFEGFDLNEADEAIASVKEKEIA